MAEVYGPRWTSAFGDDAGKGAGLTWAKGLAGLSLDQISTGVEAALVSADGWPPTLPEFRAMCLGIPSLNFVRNSINDRTLPFVRLVWMRMDGFQFRQAPADRAENILRGAYELAREYVMRGGELPNGPVAAIAEQKPVKPTRASPETAKAACDQIAEVILAWK